MSVCFWSNGLCNGRVDVVFGGFGKVKGKNGYGILQEAYYIQFTEQISFGFLLHFN